MPEGHTLHRLAREHQADFGDRAVRVSSPQGRFTAGAAQLDGVLFEHAEAHGKHLFHHYATDAVVHVHLGLYGAFTDFPLPAPEPRGQVRLRLEGDERGTDLRGPIRCDLVTPDEAEARRAKLGPDPLRDDADPEQSWRRVSRSRTSVAALLMDQSVLAGVGNVYRAEVLFRHGIPPTTPGRSLGRERWNLIWDDLIDLMADGVKVGRIDTVRPEHEPQVTGRAPREDRHGGEVYVYRRAGLPCLVCATPVALADLHARNLYWCPTCQS